MLEKNSKTMILERISPVSGKVQISKQRSKHSSDDREFGVIMMIVVIIVMKVVIVIIVFSTLPRRFRFHMMDASEPATAFAESANVSSWLKGTKLYPLSACAILLSGRPKDQSFPIFC